YAVGYTDSEGEGLEDCLIVKFNVADLSIAARKVYGGIQYDHFNAVFVDGAYVYAVGYTDSEGQGLADCLILKLNKADLSIADRKVYGGAANEQLWGVFVDGAYVYAVGYTESEGEGASDCLILKLNVADLSIAARKVYGGLGGDSFLRVFVDGSYVYAVGYTGSEGEGLEDCLIVKFNVADLSIADRKVYGGLGAEYFTGVFVDGAYVYAVGYTDSEGEGAGDCLAFSSTIPTIPIGNSVPAGFVCANSALTLANSALTLADSALTLADSALTLANSALTLADSALTLSAQYVIT
ncbi:MAG: hypothetical protein Q8N42_02115, partial [bacterium]|nr:hypothetical protein [bacterium]